MLNLVPLEPLNNQKQNMEKTKHRSMEAIQDEFVFDMEEALEKTEFGLYNYKIIFTCGLILLAVNCESYSASYVLPAAECDLNLGVKEKSILSGMTIGGIMSGQFLWGYICDTKGRRNTLLYTLLASFLTTFLASVAPTVDFFAFFRFMSGLLIACSSAIVFAYLGEFTETKYRSTALSVATIFVGLALMIIPTLAWIVLPINLKLPVFGYYNFSSWRLFTLLCGIPSLLASFALRSFPESPKFLLQMDREQEALAVLNEIYFTNTKSRDYPVKKLKPAPKLMEVQRNSVEAFVKQIFSVFKLQFLKNTLLLCTLQFFSFATSGGILLWYSEILLKLDKETDNTTSCQAISSISIEVIKQSCLDLDISIFRENLILGTGYLFGYILISALIKILGFKSMLVVLLFVSGLSGIALYWVKGNILINVLFTSFLLLSGLSVVLVNSALVDLYPTYLRAMAVSVAMFIGRLGSFSTSQVLGYMLKWNCDVTFFLFSSSLIVSAGLPFLIKKTKGLDEF